MPWAGEMRAEATAHRALLLALLAFVLCSSAARADYKESYRKGIEAVDRKEWTDAVRWMREAAGEQSREGEQVKIYGVRFEPYLPHYYLGLALFRAGDCDGALSAWQESERQGAVQGSARYKSLEEGRDTCRQRVGAKAPPPPPRPAGPDPAELARAAQQAEALLQKAVEAQAQVDRRRGDPEFAEAWKQEGAEEKKTQAADLLGRARSLLDHGKGQKQLADLQEAGRQATQARQGFESLAGRLDRRQGEIREARKSEASERLARETREKEEQRKRADEAARVEAERLAQAQGEQERTAHWEAVQGIGRASQDARKVLDRAAAAKSGDPEIQRRQTALRDLLRQAARLGDGTPLPEIDRLHSGLSTAATRLEEALLKAQGDTGPPAALRAAARAFVRADYEEVIHSLSAANLTETRAASGANLLLAAARYALYLQGGEKNPKLRQQAIDHIRACRKINARISPDAKVFSPRFTEFFKTPG